MKQAFGLFLPSCGRSLTNLPLWVQREQAGCKGVAEKNHGERFAHPTMVLWHDSGPGNITLSGRSCQDLSPLPPVF